MVLIKLGIILMLFRIIVIRMRIDRKMSQHWTYDLIDELLIMIMVERMITLKWM